MPVITAPDASHQFQIVLMTESCSAAECRATLDEAVASPAFVQHRALLVDRREAELVTVGFVDEMVSFLSTRSTALAGARMAIVTGTDAGFGMCRMLQLKVEARNPDITIRPCRSYDEAVAWLTVPEG
jgi:hypothetical protein